MSSYRIAIVGAGPAGYFAAQALQQLQQGTLRYFVDMYEKLPTPWGLVRSGVAPDHQKIKSVSQVFEKIATEDNFRLLANVTVGIDVSIKELQSAYDAVVIATGIPKGKALGIPGETLGNVISSADFIYWYNGHPEFKDVNVNLSGPRVIVIGAGNVAIDVARILVSDVKRLVSTDLAAHALDAFQRSTVRDVYITARRGAENTSFTTPELRELIGLDTVSVRIQKTDIVDATSRVDKASRRHVKSNLDTLLTISHEQSRNALHELHFLFQHKPISINGSQQVESVTFETPKGQIEIPCEMVISAIGFAPVELSGLSREADHYANIDGWIGENLYVVGWAKSGPQGVIGATKSDSVAVMKVVTSRLKEEKRHVDMLQVLRDRGVQVVLQKDWNLINSEEKLRGLHRGRPREKFTSTQEMLETAFPPDGIVNMK